MRTRLRLPNPIIAPLALTFALFVASTAASAIALGEPAAISAIGEPLHVEIPVASGGTSRVGECLRLRSGERDDGLPWVRNGRISATGSGSTSRIIISGPTAVFEPAIRLAIEDICDSRLRREYTLLLAFPELPSAPVIQSTATTPSRASEATPPAPATRDNKVSADSATPHRRSTTAEASTLTAPLQSKPTSKPRTPQADQATTKPSKSAEPPRTAAPVPAASDDRDRLVLGGGEGLPGESLRLSTQLSSFDRIATTSDEERDRLRREHQMVAALDRTIMAQMELTERIRRLEEIQAGMALHAQQLAAQNGMIAASPAQAQAVAPDAEPDAQPTKDWLYSTASLAGISLALAGALLWIRRRRTEQAAEYDTIYFPDSDENPPSEPAPIAAAKPPISQTLREKPSSPVVSVPAAQQEYARPQEVDFEIDRSPLQWADDEENTLPPVAPIIAEEEAPEEHESAIELAEIMMGFGRIQGAAETLADFIRSNPKKAVTPWLKLLEVYKTAGLRAEFDALARQLNKTFNVKSVTWDTFDEARSTERTISEMAHLVAKIQRTWGTRPCQAYLEKLLRDNRDGTREGFPLSVIDDILMLSAVLEDQLGTYRQTAEEAEAELIDEAAASTAQTSSQAKETESGA